MTSLFVFAGDVSADRHTAKLLEELKRYVPNLSVWGCGGDCMRAQGMEILHDSEKFGVFGVVEVLRSIPFFVRLCKEITTAVAQRKPDAVLLVDFSGFNLQLAKHLRKQNKDLPIIYFISPQVWGSRSWRIRTIAKTISKMLVIFPFEEALYKNAGVDVAFVGHPLTAKSHDVTKSKEQWCKALGLDVSRPIIGIMPGSRTREIKDHMPIILQSVQWLHRLVPETQFVVSQANETISQEMQKRFGQKLLQLKNNDSMVIAPVGESQQIMAYSDFLWVKSGTSALEVALAAKPMLIFYRANWLSYLVFMMFKRVKYIGMPNLLADKKLAPELMQLDCSAEQFVRHSLDFLNAPGLRAEITQELNKIRTTLGGPDFPKAAALQICKTLGLTTELSGTLSKIPT